MHIASPIDEPQRIRSLDILRGVAVLGIFVMNSRNFAYPIQQFDNPAFPGSAPARAADLWTWAIENLVFEDKMISIFSILFGAGIFIAAAKSARPALLHYRRMLWLLLFGALHAYGLWYGDILNTYAICGAIVFPFRRLPPALLIGIGVIVLMMSVWIRVEPRIAATIEPSAVQAPESAGDRIIRESIEREDAAYHGSYWQLARWRAHLNTFWHWHGGIDLNFWRCGGLMLIGMGLVQLGVLSATRPSSFYWGLLLCGYGAGALFASIGFWPQLNRALGRPLTLSPDARAIVGTSAWAFRQAGAACIAIGHIGLVMLLCRARSLTVILRPLAAVGRMALSNYIMHTLIAVAIFDGWALGQWGTWRMSEVAILVVSVWLLQLVLSPLWLRYFRFGPLEWAWRSLTYWRAQPQFRLAG